VVHGGGSVGGSHGGGGSSVVHGGGSVGGSHGGGVNRMFSTNISRIMTWT
jgi:hypothetical protein